jgi:hypothetical protein
LVVSERCEPSGSEKRPPKAACRQEHDRSAIRASIRVEGAPRHRLTAAARLQPPIGGNRLEGLLEAVFDRPCDRRRRFVAFPKQELALILQRT